MQHYFFKRDADESIVLEVFFTKLESCFSLFILDSAEIGNIPC